MPTDDAPLTRTRPLYRAGAVAVQRVDVDPRVLEARQATGWLDDRPFRQRQRVFWAHPGAGPTEATERSPVRTKECTHG